MSNKTYRIKANVGSGEGVIHIPLMLTQDFDFIDVLSLQLYQKGLYKTASSQHGCLVGRVVANNGVGVPNAKISIFIESKEDASVDAVRQAIYPYASPNSTNVNNIRYNLFPSERQGACHQNIGTFPDKRQLLDNDILLDIYKDYYKYTTRSNDAGDYMLFGLPLGAQKLHVDIDLSDIGFLSQKPTDMMFKGYNIDLFDSPSMFKKDTNLDSLTQVISEDSSVFIYPFWGDPENDEVAITRHDVLIQYKFEPTAVFMGGAFGDSPGNYVPPGCKAGVNAGKMDTLVSAEGSIEMIRTTPTGTVENFQIRGNQLIDGDGVWCYQIPMNLDYVVTNEYGNLVPSDDPDKGIPTRASVRFRFAMNNPGGSSSEEKRAYHLVPHNPKSVGEIDYSFGVETEATSFVDMLWNKVYSVKQYIPRLQVAGTNEMKSRNTTGIKSANSYGSNNPIPFNKLYIEPTKQFRWQCIFQTAIIKLARLVNRYPISIWNRFMDWFGGIQLFTGFAMYFGIRIKVPVISFTVANWIAKDGEPIFQLCVKTDDWGCDSCDADGTDNTAGDGWFKLGIWFKLRCGRPFCCWAVKNKMACITYPSFCYDDPAKANKEYFAPGCKNPQCNCTNDPTGSTCSGINCDGFNGDQECENPGWTKNGDYCVTERNSDGLMEQNLYCLKVQLANEYGVVNYDFNNDWLNGSLYFPSFKTQFTRKRRKRFFGIFGSKAVGDAYLDYCGRKSDNNEYENSVVVNACAPKIDIANKAPQDCSGGCSTTGARVELGEGVVKKLPLLTDTGEEDTYYYNVLSQRKGSADGENPITLLSTDVILLGSLDECDRAGVPMLAHELPATSYNDIPYLVEMNNEDTFDEGSAGPIEEDRVENPPPMTFNGDTMMSGAAWGIYGEDQTTNSDAVSSTIGSYGTPGGLFYTINCGLGVKTSVTTLTKSCINAQRVCEVGVSIDERLRRLRACRDQEVIPDGFVSMDSLLSGEVRQKFATLNGNPQGLRAAYNPKVGYKTHPLKYYYPKNFDGLMYSAMSNTQVNQWATNTTDNPPSGPVLFIRKSYTNELLDKYYYNFRFGKNADSATFEAADFYDGTTAQFPKYRNSFYFFFGLRPGRSAVDKFRTKFYSPCAVEEDVRTAASDDATLRDLRVSVGMLSPRFDPDVTSYTVNVPYSVASITISAAANNLSAPINGVGSQWLKEGTNTFNIVVTSEDNTATKTYVVTVNRDSGASLATLSRLFVYEGTLKPTFSSNTTSYTVNVSNSITDTTIYAFPTFEGATVSGAGDKTLNVGSNTFSVVVTSQDGTNSVTYTVTVVRAASSNAFLSSLTVSEGTLSPEFSYGTTEYTVSVGYSVESITFGATTIDDGATIADGDIGSTETLDVGLNAFAIRVKSQDGRQNMTYTVIVTREAYVNNNLSSLTVSPGTMNPPFDTDAPPDKEYGVTVGNEVLEVQITAVAEDPNAGVKVEGSEGTGSVTHTQPLIVGSNYVLTRVTSINGEVKAYNGLIITREGEVYTLTITVNNNTAATDINFYVGINYGSNVVYNELDHQFMLLAVGPTTYTMPSASGILKVSVGFDSASTPSLTVNGYITANTNTYSPLNYGTVAEETVVGATIDGGISPEANSTVVIALDIS